MNSQWKLSSFSTFSPPLLSYVCKNKMKTYSIGLLLFLLWNLAAAQPHLPNKSITMETISPNIFVKDLKATVEFYKILGFETVTTVPEAGEPIFVMMACGKITFMFQSFKSIENTLPLISRNEGGSLLLYINVKGIRALYERIKDKVQVLHGLEKAFYGATEFSIRDNNNFMLTFAEDE
jgi:uncharacterized glyoxalase superfamily protein PhnB